MDLTIYSYGYSEIIYHTLQALAMFRNSNFYPSILSTMALATGVFYAWRMAAARQEGEWRIYIRKVLGMIFLINALLLPTTPMYIKDHVEKHFWKVDNIPLAFALPIGILEEFGHLVAGGFEQVFTLVDGASSHSYYHYGTVFGARLKKELLHAKVHDPEFISNMHNFISRCVIMPAMIGKQFTKEELVATDDMWGLVSKNAGSFTRMSMMQNGERSLPTCKEAVPYFERKYDDAVATSITSWSWKFKGTGRDSKYNPGYRQLNNNLKKQIGALYGVSREGSVDKLIKHNMMINALNGYRSSNYASARAQLHQEASSFLSADMAEKTLTASLAVMKVIVYGSFIFLFPLLVISGGIAKYKNWIIAAFSLTLWPAIFSMLNMIMDYAYEPSNIISYSSWSTEVKKMDSIASIAANLTLMTPFLSFWITRMGEGGFVQMASSIMSGMHSATSAVAGERSSGNRSWDNTSIGNDNSYNTNRYKHDTNMQYVTGSARSMLAQGETQQISPSGQVVHFGGAGISSSSGEARYMNTENIGTAISNHLSKAHSLDDRNQATLTKAQDSLITTEASALAQIHERMNSDQNFSLDTSTEEGRDVAYAMNQIDRLTESNGFSWQQNAEAYLRGELSIGKKAGDNSFLDKMGNVPIINKIANVPIVGTIAKLLGMEAGAGGKLSAVNQSQQNDSQESQYSDETHTTNKYGTGERTTDHQSYGESLGIDKSTMESMREAYNETKRAEEARSISQNEVDTWQATKDYHENHGSEYARDMTQNVIDNLQTKYGMSSSQAYREVRDGTMRARQVFDSLSNNDAMDLKDQITSGKDNITNSNAVDNFVKDNSNKINSNNLGSKVRQFAKDHDMKDSNTVQNEISDQGKQIKDHHQVKYAGTTELYLEEKGQTGVKYDKKQKEIDKYEEDRIGRGKMSKIPGYASNIITLGFGGANIGRPNTQSQSLPELPDFGEPIARPYKGSKQVQEFDWDKATGITRDMFQKVKRDEKK